MDKKFWMVWKSKGASPTVKHILKSEAEKEAQRLACIERDNNFYVLEAVSVSRDTSRLPIIETVNLE